MLIVEAYAELCQTSKMEFFAKIAKAERLSTFTAVLLSSYNVIGGGESS